jgi:hypothetical protein
MGNFLSIKIEAKVAKRFRKVSPSLAASHSLALTVLLDNYDHLSEPRKDAGSNPAVKLLLANNDRNTNRMVSILKSMEKDKIDRILSMLLVLFDHGAKRKNPPKPSLKHINSAPSKEMENKGDAFALIQLEEEKLKLVDEIHFMKKDINELLHKKTKLVQPTLGKAYVRLDIDSDGFNKLKEQFILD